MDASAATGDVISQLNLLQQQFRRPASGGVPLFADVADAPQFTVACTFYAAPDAATPQTVRGHSARSKRDARHSAAAAALAAIEGRRAAGAASSVQSTVSAYPWNTPTFFDTRQSNFVGASYLTLQDPPAQTTSGVIGATDSSWSSPPNAGAARYTHGNPSSAAAAASMAPQQPPAAGAPDQECVHQLEAAHMTAAAGAPGWSAWPAPKYVVHERPAAHNGNTFYVQVWFCAPCARSAPALQTASARDTSLKGAMRAAARAALAAGSPRPMRIDELDDAAVLTAGQFRALVGERLDAAIDSAARGSRAVRPPAAPNGGELALQIDTGTVRALIAHCTPPQFVAPRQ